MNIEQWNQLHGYCCAQNVALGAIESSEVQKLFHSAKRYQFAALQDNNPLIQFLHNSYAVALVDAIRDLVPDASIASTMVGEDFTDFRNHVIALQAGLEARAMELLKHMDARVLASGLGKVA